MIDEVHTAFGRVAFVFVFFKIELRSDFFFAIILTDRAPARPPGLAWNQVIPWKTGAKKRKV